jgi:hypothetical protein
MTPQEIQERSRQIEKMLGWELVLLNPEDKDTGDLLMYWFENEQLKRIYSGDEMEILEEDSTLPFDTDWNWLHESVDFIKKIDLSEFNYHVGNMTLFRVNKHVIEKTSITSKKEAAFIVVSDFAKLYNEGKL